MNHEVVRTRAGDLAMRSVDAGEVMHPGVGPLVEARELYVRQSRLAERLRETSGELTLFDVGLGAGSNALAARAESERRAQCADVSENTGPTTAQAENAGQAAARLRLISFERDLGALHLALDHGAAFGLDGEAGIAARALLTTNSHESARTLWQLRSGELLDCLAVEPTRADIVFWDPFSPRANPLLWTIAAFSALRRVAGARCTVLTYSASTATRVALLLAGFLVGIGDSIGDKRQTTFAATDMRDLVRPLDRQWLSRLSRPDAPMPSDAPRDAVARIAALAQFAAGEDF